MGGQLKSVSLPRAPGINVFKPFRLPLWKTGDTPAPGMPHATTAGKILLPYANRNWPESCFVMPRMPTKHRRKFFDPHFRPHEKRFASIMACIIFWSVLSYAFISRGVFSGAAVIGSSMHPTLGDGDRVFLNRLVYQLETPRRGDVVALEIPQFEDMSVKRIVALPGETIQIIDNTVLVNGRALDEPYLAGRMSTRPGALTTNVYRVDPFCYFVLGDNREDSLDSRSFGAIPAEWIRGRVMGSGLVQYKY